jgi:fucose permease
MKRVADSNNLTKVEPIAPGRIEIVEPGRADGAKTGHALFTKRYLVPFILVTSLFFLWGIPNNLNDVLIRQFMTSFSLTRFQAGLVQSAFYLGYFCLAMPAALLMRRLRSAC